MKRKKLVILFLLIVSVGVYFLLFQKDKTLKYIPNNTDAIILLDVKKISRQYIYNFARHPSQWFADEKKDENSISLKNSGLKTPDFIQIFHIKDSRFSHWYSVLEIKDQQKLKSFLNNKKFVDKGKNRFQKDQMFIKIEGDHCIFGTSDVAFNQISKEIFPSNKNKNLNADQFSNGGIGSFSFLSGKKIANFSIELNEDNIEIKNISNTEVFSSIIAKIQEKNPFLESELDAKNIKNVASFFNKSLADSTEIHYLKTSSMLQQVNDTIITYGYDDDFNEVEKIAVQKIVQPNYTVSIQSKNLEKTWTYFQNKKWINAQNQFTIIPFQPNFIYKNKDKITIESTKNKIQLAKIYNENYIYFKNDPLLMKFFTSFENDEKKMISDVDYIFFGNKAENYFLKVQMKKGKLPLILR